MNMVRKLSETVKLMNSKPRLPPETLSNVDAKAKASDKRISRWIERASSLLLLLMGTGLGMAAFIQMFRPAWIPPLTQETLLAVLVAAALLLARRLKEINFGSTSLKLQEMDQEIAEVQKGVDAVLANDKERALSRDLAKKADAEGTDPDLAALKAVRIRKGPVDDDPWKNVFGGKAISEGRELRATVERLAPRSAFFRVRLEVVSVGAQKPLTGYVRFFLHPEFDPEKPFVTVGGNGVAAYEIEAYGAFTVGALADCGQTRLELDLRRLPGVEADFRAN